MNLINILDRIKDDLESNRKDILEADTVRFILKLNDEIFSKIKPNLQKITDIKDMFQLKVDKELVLKDFQNYGLDLYGTHKEFEV